MNKYTWHDIVKECERILECDDTAKSPSQSNLPNLIRDLQTKIHQLTNQSNRPEYTCSCSPVKRIGVGKFCPDCGGRNSRR